MSTPKPRPYHVELSRLEHGSTVVWATSAKEAEKIAWEEYPEWTFEPGDFTGMPKASMLRGAELRFNDDYGYRRTEPTL